MYIFVISSVVLFQFISVKIYLVNKIVNDNKNGGGTLKID